MSFGYYSAALRSPLELLPSTEGQLRVIRVDGVDLHVDSVELWVDERRIHITLHEFKVLGFLMDRAGSVVSRQEALDGIWGPRRGTRSNTLSVTVSRLRRKLTRPDGTTRIRTVRNVGYIFDIPARRKTTPPNKS